MSRKQKSKAQEFIDVMTSMRLTIFVLIILACASILIIIFQDYHPTNFYGWEEHYRTHMNPVAYSLTQFFQLFTPYNSWWFISLLTILCVSLLLCSIQRFKIILRLLMVHDDFRQGEDLSRQENFYQIKMAAESAVSATTRLLKRKFYKVYTRNESGATYLFAKKHSISRLGPFLSHIGLLALFVGGLLAALFGRSLILWGGPGEYISAPFAKHKLYVEDFTIEFNDKGQIKDYLSFLKVYDEDSTHVFDQVVEVNGPLRYDGISYYQSSYRLHPRKAKYVTIALTDTLGNPVDTITVDFASSSEIPETGYSIEFAGFAADFQITKDGVISKSEQLNNPAFLLQFLRGDEAAGHQWLFARFPSVHANQDAPFSASYVNFEPYYYTGLQVSMNPGSPFIWAGFIVMTIGLILVFYFNHRLVWAVFITREDKQDELYIAGSCHKFKEQFKQEMKEIASKIKAVKSANGMTSPGNASHRKE